MLVILKVWLSKATISLGGIGTITMSFFSITAGECSIAEDVYGVWTSGNALILMKAARIVRSD